ncbi:hypothetical protein Pth03_49690 [Planotetraspora thailandica]|uniref:PLL-like beta propeller domain-containing protein n=1 Tax=Planotetraspora thailandica TaxID=487172 RepID=A0A8J3VEE1_9ACTN|nr:hypothetical protein [Planotetraspora thailandica]GII56580.1 hypothetical protein Pth03_49690 [Planotetraspora thailandica]
MFSWKKWRLAAIAILAAFSVLIVTGTPASAANAPGEWDYWRAETVNGSQHLYAAGTIAEARNGSGRLLRVWRANDDTGYLWAAWDNSGQAYRLDGAYSWASPTVVRWGNNGFALFHTGTDGRIYWATYDESLNWSGWHAISGQTTQLSTPVSVTQVGTGSRELYMVYRSGSDFGMWGSFFNGGNWQNAQNLGGRTYFWPTVTWNQSTHRLYAGHTGQDGHVYLQWQEYGGTWHGWFSVGGDVNGAPTIATSSTGNMQVAGRDWDSFVWYREFNAYGYPLRDWTQDPAFLRAAWPVFLSVAGAVIYSIATTSDRHDGFYKQSFSGSS